MTPKRPIVRYHGGKWKLADWIISHFPFHRCYVEPYGGGGSVLLKKPRSYAEIYNDLDSEIVNLFSVVRDSGDKLKEKLRLTPFSRNEFLEAWNPTTDKLEQARRTVIRAFMGFGSAAVTMNRAPKKARGGIAATGFRANSNRSGTTPAHDWANYADALPGIIDRLQGVVIENRDAMKVMLHHDSAETLHYVDPPYLAETRDSGGDYVYEMSEQDHIELAEFLNTLKGFVVLSGYESTLYADLYKGWNVIKRNAYADGAKKRIEVLWIKGEIPQMRMEL